ncbi:hypothetical protein BJ878DRAFT_430928 [Calycina marina]|uniref:CSN8/PSMD8/EIF3K domain-containing protein n=1 Tax=Calycina marina TaxID=1763456 RepID=A0A9P8CAP8_9HELO|nr:hypothetical protein BJ878DRAFT_430928 [Calycina marina]
MSTRGGYRGGRGSSWSRLKPVNLDPLEAIGLPSKGDTRLLDNKTQEKYYAKIVEKYMEFCTDAGRGDELLRRLAHMDLSAKVSSTVERPQTAPSNLATPGFDTSGRKALSTLMMAMRKLREGIVASNRVDDFSIQAYIFCIRLSILLKHMESYHPAILHLLKKMHKIQPLTSTELQEFVGYLVLDLACRQNDLAQAFAVKRSFKLHDTKVDAALKALVHDNYFMFWRVARSVDGHKAKLMEFADDCMRKQTLKCIGCSYMNMDLLGLENYTNSPWNNLVKQNEVGWQLEGTKVIIRKPKTR